MTHFSQRAIGRLLKELGKRGDFGGEKFGIISQRHCEKRSDEAILDLYSVSAIRGLLRSSQ